MTISSLLKKRLGVNGLVVDEVEFQGSETGEQMIVQGHVTKARAETVPGMQAEESVVRPGARRTTLAYTGYGEQHEGVHPGGCATD